MTEGDFPVVGIGASAGGLEALEEFFKNMPEKNGMAFVVIQHLDPDNAGIMPELLQRITSMKVIQATDRLYVKPNCVYVIPPNKSMSILHGALHLFEPFESRGLRLPVDVFFRSLAIDRNEKSIAVILSGMGSDGSLGVKDIKVKNGIVLVQDPSTAKFDGMPRSATASVNADIVAPPNELPARLIKFLNFIPSEKSDTIIDLKNESNIDKIIILLREHTGHDFSLYKKNTLLRRIERRMDIHQIGKIDFYIRFLQLNPKELEILFKELLIGVTSFFRDNDVWQMLKEKVFPGLISELPDKYTLRAWVPGCSTGEEAYSLAIVFREAIEKTAKQKNISLQIFATDLDADAIDKARKAYFPKNIVSNVSRQRLKRFFSEENDGYRLHADIREMVVFAQQNVIKDPPFTKLDILSCRNLLIYFEPELQKKLITLYSYSLKPGGIMLLGTAETLGVSRTGFKVIDAKLKIFKHLNSTSAHELIDFPSSFYFKKSAPLQSPKPMKEIENMQYLADQLLLQKYAPASVLVNENGDIIYVSGHTGKYLEPAAGKANWNIYAMAREGLRNELHGALRKTINNSEEVILSNIKINDNGIVQVVDVILKRIDKPEQLKGMIMLVFSDVKVVSEADVLRTKKSSSKNAEIKELELELQRIHAELQSTREEMQTSQEELKASNEELQSTNEELQSTNEELTTSKEEMQSLNEEMQTVNMELQSKVSDYMRTNDDMKNLLNSTEIATLFLDRALNIRRFTQQLTKIFKLRESDIGRPFTDLVNDLQYPEIDKHAREVLKSLMTIETAIATNDERWFNVRIMPYRTLDDRIDGLVITFTDITVLKNLEIELQKANEKLRSN